MANPRSSDINSIFSDNNSSNDDNDAYQITISPANEIAEQVPKNPVDFTRAQKAGQATLKFVNAYANTVFRSFPTVSPYREIWETTATAINAIIGDIGEAFINQEDLLISMKRAGLKKLLIDWATATTIKLTSLSIVAGCGYAIGLVAVTFVPQFLESESALERTIGRILDEEVLRKSTLFLTSYPLFRFFEFVLQKGVDCFWPRNAALPVNGEHYINSLQQGGKDARRTINQIDITATLFTFANKLGFQESGYSATNYVLLTDMVVHPLTWYCYTKDPKNKLDIRGAAELLLGPQHSSHSTTPEQDIKDGAKIRLIKFSIWTGVTFFWSKLVTYNYPDLYEENRSMYYLTNVSFPFTARYLFENAGEIKTDLTSLAKRASFIVAKTAAILTPITRFASFFKQAPRQEVTQPLFNEKQAENYGAITKPTL